MSGGESPPTVLPYGDAAILIVLGDRIDPTLNRRVHALAAAIAGLAGRTAGIGRPVPAYGSLLVPVDPLTLPLAEAAARLADVTAAEEPAERGPLDEGSLVDIPTRYGGLDGPDLAELASTRGLTESEVVELHASVDYLVYFLGFAPGFAYLGPVPPQIATPRRDTPRPRVPAGSVGIAGEQTGIYPAALPGGWQLIGRTDMSLWDPAASPPALLAPGARVRFVPLGGRAAR